MLQNLQVVLVHMVQGAIASSLLPTFLTLVSVITCNRSLVSNARKLALDSNIRLLLQLAGIGAAVSGLSATLLGGAGGDIDILTGLVCFKAGVFYTIYRLWSLNNAYLKRARACLDAGDFRGAMEDAGEVARSSERLRKVAREIRSEAERNRSAQLVAAM